MPEPKQKTNVTDAQAEVVAERERRLAEALRENLKRRKMPTQKSDNDPNSKIEEK